MIPLEGPDSDGARSYHAWCEAKREKGIRLRLPGYEPRNEEERRWAAEGLRPEAAE